MTHLVSILQILILILLLTACEKQLPANRSVTIQIPSRDEGNRIRYPLYAAKIPIAWSYSFPDSLTSIQDTRKPLCTLHIKDANGDIDIHIHNFPSETIKDRIPSSAQITRWQHQFDVLDRESIEIRQQAFGGFVGTYMHCFGKQKEKDIAILAWALQIGSHHYAHLILDGTPEDKAFGKQMRADVTIKASGSPDAIRKYKNEIITFVRSFHLIQEIPIN